jgi:hypothetical protein
MNERIRQLAEQAGFMEAWFSESGDDCEREIKKFAELIVQECASIDFRREVGLTADDDYEISKVIKVHFGVEQ